MSKALHLKANSNIDTDNYTVEQYIARYYKDSILGNHNRRKCPHKRPEQALRYLDIISNKFGNKLLGNIKKHQLTLFIKEFSIRGPRTADVLRVHLASIYADAFENGLIQQNPMLGVSSKVSGYKQQNKTRVLSDDEILLVFNSAHPNAAVLRFLLLTGLRISEARQGYIDGDYFKLDDTKNGTPDWVYLSDLAKAQLPLPVSTDTNIQHWLKRWLIKEGIKERFTCHDLRRTFATRLHERIEPYVVERCLNHKLEGVMAVYNKASYKEQRVNAAKVMESIALTVIQKI